MTGDRSGNGRWWPLLALPVLCCAGHVLLIAAGVGSLAAVTGSVTGSTAAAAGGLLLAAAAMVVLLRRPRRPRATVDPPGPAAPVPDGGAR